uniref:Anion exchange protein n=1 Tax=Syphacia muris TaxID=451379 RepID=A0A0N5AHG9_9BILA
MPVRRGSHSGQDFRGSQSSIRRRKSISEEYPRPSVLGGRPIHNVRQILEANPDANPMLFTEMLELSSANDELGTHWNQVSRWIRYEQTVEGDGTRFSKPHITLLSVVSLIQVKNCLRKGVIILDAQVNSFADVADTMCAAWVERGFLNEETAFAVKEALNSTKLHLIDGRLRSADDKRRDDRSDVRPESSEKKERECEEAENDSRELKKIAPGTEAAVILIGHLCLLEKPICALVRIEKSKLMFPEVPNIPLPVKFVFVLLNPHEHYSNETLSIGRTMGALFADEIFRKIAVCSFEPFTIADAVDEFFTQIVAVPPGNCSTESRWEPHENSGQEVRSLGTLYACYDDAFEEEPIIPKIEESHCEIKRTGQLFGGLYEDLKTKVPFYLSDYTDFFRGRLSQSFAAAIFLFFANVTSIITFGAVMEKALHRQVAAIENILCGGISGVLFGLFSGQPLNILSATGPTLVFETILYDFCLGYKWEFLPFRLWVGVWIAVLLLILVATDMSALVGLITRFTEDAFATLISIVFIVQAFEKLFEVGVEAPITTDPDTLLNSPCQCVDKNSVAIPLNHSLLFNHTNTTFAEECTSEGGSLVGMQCHFKPDVYVFSILLTFGTFALTYGLNIFRKTNYLSSTLRNSISDFCVLIAIIVMTALSQYIGLEVPVLDIPASFRPTIDRSWVVDPTRIEGWYVAAIAVFPAMFYTILIVMDQQITAVIINRNDNKLRKGYGYHLDLFVIAGLIVICSFLGLPFYVAATVLSVMHVDALRLQSDTSAPGEKAQFLGVKEQRLTAVLAHVLIGLSVFLTPIIKLVPLPVLIGVFLYMGVVSMLGLQFVQRIAMLFMPIKYQPDYPWIRTVRMKRVHLFTFLQILSIVGLFAVKYAKKISMMFPLMLVFMVIIRMFLLEKLFTQQELSSLDDIVPTFRSVVKPTKRAKIEAPADGEELQKLTNAEEGIVEKRNGGK